MPDSKTINPSTTPDRITGSKVGWKLKNVGKTYQEKVDFVTDQLWNNYGETIAIPPEATLEEFKTFLRVWHFAHSTNPELAAELTRIGQDVVIPANYEALYYYIQTKQLDVSSDEEKYHAHLQEINAAKPKGSVASSGDPVNLFNGNFNYNTVDFQIQGAAINFSFTRSYSQLSFYNGPLGYNWDHNYNLWLRVSEDGLTINRSTGALRTDSYKKHDLYNYWMPPDGFTAILVEEADSYTLKLPDGGRIKYQPHPTLHPRIHVVKLIEDRYGNFLSFNYNHGILSEVLINNPARKINFSYDSFERITSISDFTGRKWQYRYDDWGDLVYMITPNTNEYKRGLVTSYDYSTPYFSDPEAQHNITSITDADGKIYLENEYGTNKNLLSFNRVIRQRQGNGECYFDYSDVIEDFNFLYYSNESPATQTIVTERDGRTSRNLYNKYGNLIFQEQYARINGIPSLVSSHFRYNKDGNLIGSITPLGVITQYLYGRDYYEKKFVLNEDYVNFVDSNLTIERRAGFNNLLAVVHRFGYYNMNELNMSLGIWSADIFPDVFDTNPNDIISKFTYEPDFNQVISKSDVRFTQSADPDFTEAEQYFKTLIKYNYSPAKGFNNFYFHSVNLPQSTSPDGTVMPEIKTFYTDYNTFGNPLKIIAPNGLQLTSEYLAEESGLLKGFAKSTTVDPDGLNIKVESIRDNLGRIIKSFRPKYFDFEDDRFYTTNIFNNLDQVISNISSAPQSVTSNYFFNRTGNIKKAFIQLKDENNLESGVYESLNKYDEEFHLIDQVTGNASESLIKRTRIVYDRSGRPAITIAPSGLRNKVMYNERGIEWLTINDYGGTHSISKKYFDADGRLIKYVDPLGNVSRFMYDSLGRQIVFEDALGNKTITHFTKRGDISVRLNFEKISTGVYRLLSRKQFSYDEIGQCIKSETNKFDTGPEVGEAQLLKSFIDIGPGDLLLNRFFYNSSGKLTKKISQTGKVFLFDYDILGRLIKETDPSGNENTFQYDKENNIIRTDRKEVTRNDETGQITKTQYFASNIKYDEQNRAVEKKDSLGNKAQFFYNSTNNLTRSVDPLGNNKEYFYDLFGRVVKSKIFLHTYIPGEEKTPVESIFKYNLFDNVIEQSDALGRITGFTFNALGQQVSCILPDNTFDYSKYDLAGNLIMYTDRNGLKHTYTYDKLSRPIEVKIDTASVIDSIGGSLNFRAVYDPLGRITRSENDFIINEFNYNSLGWNIQDQITTKASAGIPEQRFTISRGFNESGSLRNLIYPSGRKIEYSFDGLERVISINQNQRGAGFPGDANLPEVLTLAEIEYEGLRRKRLKRYNNTFSKYSYDKGARVNSIHHSSGTENILNIQYFYDGSGNIRQQFESSNDFLRSKFYQYDSLSRITKVNEAPSSVLADLDPFSPFLIPVSASIPDSQLVIDSLINNSSAGAKTGYQYDLAGNRLAKTRNGNAENYESNDLDQIRFVNDSELIYTKNGNLKEDKLAVYTYDHANLLAEFTEKATGSVTKYYYDSLGRRCIEVNGADVSIMIYNGFNLLEQYNNSVLYSSMVSDIGLNNYLLISIDSAEHHFYSDLSKSTRYLFNGSVKSNYYCFDEFGNLETTLDPYHPNDILFASKRLVKNIGKYDFVNRFYDIALGKFIQRDPAGYIDGFNLYNYVNNNPVTFTDLLGTHGQRQELLLGKEIQPDTNSAPLAFWESGLGMDTISKFYFTADGTFLRWNENTQTWWEDFTGASITNGTLPKPKESGFFKFLKGVDNALWSPVTLVEDTGAKVIDMTTQGFAALGKVTGGWDTDYTTWSSTSKAVEAGVPQSALIWDATGGLIVNPIVRIGDAIFLQDPEAIGEVVTGIALGAFFKKMKGPAATAEDSVATNIPARMPEPDIGSQLLQNRDLALRSSQMRPGSASLSSMDFGNLIDSEFKFRTEANIQSGQLPGTLRTTPRGRYGVDVYDTATGLGYDLTTATVEQVARHDARYIFGGRRNVNGAFPTGRPMPDGTVITDVFPLIYDRMW